MKTRSLKILGLFFLTFFIAPQAWAGSEAVSCRNVQMLAIEKSSLETRLSKGTDGAKKSSKTEFHFLAKGNGITKIVLIFVKEEGSTNSSKCNKNEKKLTIHFSDSQLPVFLRFWKLATSENKAIHCRQSEGSDSRGVEFIAGVCTLAQ